MLGVAFSKLPSTTTSFASAAPTKARPPARTARPIFLVGLFIFIIALLSLSEFAFFHKPFASSDFSLV
jgi:hypothetical protein